jgi:hypothetical protein
MIIIIIIIIVYDVDVFAIASIDTWAKWNFFLNYKFPFSAYDISSIRFVSL